MSEQERAQLGKALWSIADQLRGAMNADSFRDYMLSFIFLRYLSDNYEKIVAKELGNDYPEPEWATVEITEEGKTEKKRVIAKTSLKLWYDQNPEDVEAFEEQMRKKVHYVIQPEFLWSHIAELARTQSSLLLERLEEGFTFVEEKAFSNSYKGLFSEINLQSDKLGKSYDTRNAKLCTIITKIAEKLANFSINSDTLGDAYEYLIGQFAAGSGKKAGEFYTPQQLSTILSKIVALDPQKPTLGIRNQINNILDFACGSGSLLLNVRHQLGKRSVGRIYGQEKNITTYNLARMNMLLHGVKDSEFKIFHGDSLQNDWELLNEMNPAQKIEFDAIVANPPFSLRWSASDVMAQDFRFKDHGLAPKSAADFAFLLHGFHFLSDNGTMAIILPHGVLFRGGGEKRIRTKLLQEGHIDTVIGLPSNLFFSTGIPVCILVLKKCQSHDDVLFINASEHYEKRKRQNFLRTGEEGQPNDIEKIVNTYKERPKEIERFARRVSMEEIEENDFNLNISRYVSTALPESKVDLKEVNQELQAIKQRIDQSQAEHNAFLKELGLDPI
ncbi:MAG: type I restriction-modification system subunit M [Aureispira sp.]